jgi:hypothetical protein
MAMGIEFTDAKLQAAARDMDEYDARLAKEKAEAESPDEDIDDAWDQHDEEVKEQSAPDYDREKETESVDDILRGIAEDFGNPLPKREVPAKPDPAEEIAEAIRRAKATASE